MQEIRYFSEIGGRVLLSRRVDRDRVPPPVPRDPRDSPLEPAPRRERLLVRAVAADPAEYVPDVGDERAQPRDDGRALHVLRHEPSPAVVVLHLVEDVLARPLAAPAGFALRAQATRRLRRGRM